MLTADEWDIQASAPSAEQQLAMFEDEQALDEYEAAYNTAAWDALARCTDLERTVWKLHRGWRDNGTTVQGASYEEIGTYLGMARQTVIVAYQRADYRVVQAALQVLVHLKPLPKYDPDPTNSEDVRRDTTWETSKQGSRRRKRVFEAERGLPQTNATPEEHEAYQQAQLRRIKGRA